MPIRIDVTELKPGMITYQPVCNEYTTLLPAGKELSDENVKTLKRLFPQHNIQVCDPLLDGMFEFEDSSVDVAVATEVQRTIGQCIESIKPKLNQRTHIPAAEVAALRAVARRMYDHLLSNPVSQLILQRAPHPGRYLDTHAANVFYIAMVLANCIRAHIADERLRQSRARHIKRTFLMDLTPLGLGCLVHDFGMFGLEDIIESPGPLTADQRQLIKEHPQRGAAMLPHNASTLVRMIVRTHHENFDGSGYPNGLPGARQHIFTRIIRVADAFDAATSNRVYASAKSEARALWEMTHGPTSACYDPVITKILLNRIRPFPVGAKLELSSGATGVVVRQSHHNPFRPQVVVAFDEHGQRLAADKIGTIIELEQRPDLKIVSFDGEDLSYLHGIPTVAEPPAAIVEDAFSLAYP